MNYFDFEYKTPIGIYGAGSRGQLFHHNLEQSGFINIQFFLDKNAKRFKSILGKDVFTLTSKTLSPQIKANTVIIISVTNVFEHKEIAKELCSVGFENIILKYISDEQISQPVKMVNEIFDNILDMKYYHTKLKPVQLVPKYDNHKIEKKTNDSVLQVIDEDFLVAAVPVELIFSLSKNSKLTPYDTEKLEKKYGLSETFDVPFFSISQQIDLVEYFNTQNPSGLENYINIIRFNYEIIEKHLTDFEIDRVISSREEVYCKMNKLMSDTTSFFSDNPVKLKWNNNGYFNILDGKHRLAFFIVKGLKFIPAKITKEDYNQWLNPSTLKNVSVNNDYYAKHWIHLLHPKFNAHISISYFHSKTLSLLINSIFQKNRNYRNKSALFLGLQTIYYFQYFHKMGIRVNLIVKGKNNYKLAKDLNRLTYINNELIKNMFTKNIDQNYDIIFIYWDFSSPQAMSDILRLFKLVNLSVTSYIMVLSNVTYEKKIISKLQSYNFTIFKALGRVHTSQDIIQSNLFKNNRVIS